MIRISMVLFLIIVLFYILSEVYKIYFKASAENKLSSIENEEEVFKMEKEAILRRKVLEEEKKNLKKGLFAEDMKSNNSENMGS